MTIPGLGWFGWRPGVLQKLNIPIGFLGALGITTFIHGYVVNGIMNVNISTIEKRFHFNSFQSGLISSSYDVIFCVLCPLVTYYGNRGNRPKFIATGLFVFVVGCGVSSLPHFLTGPYIYQRNESGLSTNCNSTNRGETGEWIAEKNYFYFFVIGMGCLGAGSIPVITLGVAYLEDSTTKGKGASYIGILGALASFGSAVGFILGGYMLRYPTDLNVGDGASSDISPSDPAWVGAWWISPILAASLAILSIICMSGFPRQPPVTGGDFTLSQTSRESEVHARAGSRVTEQFDFGKTSRDFPTALKLLLKNPTFLFTTLACSFESFILNGFAVFLPKVFQNQFHLNTSDSAFVAGAVSVPAAILGHFLSGFMVKRFSMRTPQILRAAVIAAVLSAMLTPCTLVYCDSPLFAPPKRLMEPANLDHNAHHRFNSTSSCLVDCGDCSKTYAPVCGGNGLTYFSACHAGCQQHWESLKIFHNCSCTGSDFSEVGEASKGICASGCYLIIPYLILLFLLVFLSFAVLTPSVVVILRCVPRSQKSFAIGIQWFFIRILGSIPSPVVIGVVFDASCIAWQQPVAGEQGACWIYDSGSFAKFGLIIALTCKLMSALCFGTAFRFYAPERMRVDGAVKSVQNAVLHPLPSKSLLD